MAEQDRQRRILAKPDEGETREQFTERVREMLGLPPQRDERTPDSTSR